MTLSDRARLAVNLRIAREAARVSQKAAGEAVRKTRGTIVNWENPENPAEPDSDEVATLARLYHVTSRDLRFSELRRPTTAVVVPPSGTMVQSDTAEGRAAAVIQAEKDRAAIAAETSRPTKRKAGGET